MSYSYKLPQSGTAGSENQIETRSTNTNAVIIIGANGSGKSRLGAWIEKTDAEHIHRIGAQRNNTISESIKLRSYNRSMNQILYSHEDVDRNPHLKTSKSFFYQNGRWTSYERNDIDYVLSAIFAKRTEQLEAHDEKAKQAPNQMLQRESNIVDDIQDVWNEVYPHRNVKFRDAKIYAVLGTDEYNGIEMSDGERVALYLIAQALLVPQNVNTIIIDEPEIHLHRSIMNRLWSAIEAKRNDCLFVYITHDTQFAANHHTADKIWVKSFDGANWDWELVDSSDLPEQLLLDILGNRKPVLFVEGTVDSYDTKLYEVLYPNHYIIPCGSCTEVVLRTKAVNATPQISHVKAVGIIDRDYRSDAEIEKLSEKGVYTLAVAEVENLFITKEVLSIINTNAAHSNEDKINEAINFIIDEKFANMRNQQIRAAAISECKYQLSVLDISAATSDEVFQHAVSSISFERIHSDFSRSYDLVFNQRDYAGIMRIFNAKELSKSIGHFFGVNNNDYCDLVIRLAKGSKQSEIRAALRPYLPNEVDSEIATE